MKNTKNKDTNNRKYLGKIFTFFFTFFISTILISGIVFSQDEQEVFINSTGSNTYFQEGSINIQETIISNNLYKEEIEVLKEDIEFTTHYRNNSSLDKGKSQVIQEGIDGQKETIVKKIYENEELISEYILSEEIIKNPRSKIIEIGTKEKTTSNLNKNSTTNNGSNGLTFSINLYKPSGFTYNQFIKALSGNSKDTNKIIENNAQYFYYAEQQYGINGMFLAAVAIHESGWATSKIAIEKNNLFGYGAYDSSPYESAWSFENYSECIDLLARVFTKYYLSEGGKFYNGTTLTSVNTRYATDTGWAIKVYSHMKTLYGRV